MERRQQQIRRRRRKRRLRRIRVFLTMLFIVVLGGGVLYVGAKKLNSRLGKEQKNIVIKKKHNVKMPSVDLEQLNSRHAVLIDQTSGEIVAEFKSEEKIYPASLTKIMTAIVAIENTKDLNGTMIMPSDIFPGLHLQNASMAGFEPGEEVRYIDLLYGVMLPSGADACMAFAEDIGGSEKEFVKLMNKKAKKLGMENTHFTNVTGLHDWEHYSTVNDMAVLLEYALENETFRGIFTSSKYVVPSTVQHPNGMTFHSTMFQEMDGAEVTGGEILGGKTGYTKEAGLCLASYAEINGNGYILVTAEAEGNHHTEPFHIEDAVTVYDQIGGKR